MIHDTVSYPLSVYAYSTHMHNRPINRNHPTDTGALDAASQFKPYFRGPRVKVQTTYPSGETFTRTGRVSMSTGWRPVFLLIHRSNAYGSWDTLTGKDKIIAIQHRPGGPYIET